MVRRTDIAASPGRPDRLWRGRTLHPLEEIRMFFRDEGPVPETFRRLKSNLESRGIPYVVMGATALGVHGFVRASEDVDVCLRESDLERLKRELVGREHEAVPGRARRFYDPVTDVTFDVLVAGEIAGNSRKQQAIRFPDPREAEIVRDTPVPSLARLVELKLVTWRYKDWGDVVELIRVHRLDESFADRLHPVARSAYLQCYDQKVEEDRYDPQIHDSPPEPA